MHVLCVTLENDMAKTPAERKREHDNRKREAGLVEFRRWVTPEECAALRRCLLELREGK